MSFFFFFLSLPLVYSKKFFLSSLVQGRDKSLQQAAEFGEVKKGFS